MKYASYLIVSILVVGIGYYVATPGQQRLGDNYMPQGYAHQEADPSNEQDLRAHRETPILTFFYAKDDTQCAGELIPVTFIDLDNRIAFQEITSVVALLSHPLPKEYRSAFIPGTSLNQLQIRDGIATVDLSSFLTLNGEKGCGLTARTAQLEATLKQFETIESISLLVNGEPLK